MNCDNRLEPKNFPIAALIGFGVIRSRHQVVGFCPRQALLTARSTREAGAELVFASSPDRADTTVAEDRYRRYHRGRCAVRPGYGSSTISRGDRVSWFANSICTQRLQLGGEGLASGEGVFGMAREPAGSRLKQVLNRGQRLTPPGQGSSGGLRP